jgi:hypothetical protein
VRFTTGEIAQFPPARKVPVYRRRKDACQVICVSLSVIRNYKMLGKHINEEPPNMRMNGVTARKCLNANNAGGPYCGMMI